MSFYKLQHKETQLYVKGTPVYHNYDKNGRIFTSIGALRTFLTNVLNSEYRRERVLEWRVIELEMRVTDIKDVMEVIKPEKTMKLLQAGH